MVVRTWWSLLVFLLGCTNTTFFLLLQNSTHIGSSFPCCHLSALEWEMGHWQNRALSLTETSHETVLLPKLWVRMWIIINSALLPCPHSFSQSRLHGQIQYVCNYETLTLIGVTETGVNLEFTLTKQGGSKELKRHMCHRQRDWLHSGKVGCEYCLHCKWHVTFSFRLLPLFWLPTAAPRLMS